MLREQFRPSMSTLSRQWTLESPPSLLHLHQEERLSLVQSCHARLQHHHSRDNSNNSSPTLANNSPATVTTAAAWWLTRDRSCLHLLRSMSHTHLHLPRRYLHLLNPSHPTTLNTTAAASQPHLCPPPSPSPTTSPGPPHHRILPSVWRSWWASSLSLTLVTTMGLPLLQCSSPNLTIRSVDTTIIVTCNSDFL